jgi:hydroxymethylpyrimidine/phosphomethylpyrimidine kinase
VRGEVRADRWPRLPPSYHGSGCPLASAIAAGLAKGVPVPQAVYAAQQFTWQSLAAGYRPGRGQHVPNRLFAR